MEDAMGEQEYKVTKVYIEGSDGCYINLEIDELLLDVAFNKIDHILFEIRAGLEAMEFEREIKKGNIDLRKTPEAAEEILKRLGFK
jgi:hypothetical protein